MSPFRARASLGAQLRYLRVLLWRFRVTFGMLFVVWVGGSLLIDALYHHEGKALTFPQALGVTYFLMLGQPSTELPRGLLGEALFIAIPPLALLALADGIVRFAYLFFAMHRNDKEWFAVLAETLKDHVIICGAGRIGYRVVEQLGRLGVPVVVIERKADAAFAGTLRAAGIPLFVDDVKSHQALEAAHIRTARAVVCATDDDLANLNIAVDARRMNPKVRVVIRLFDDDLVLKMKETLGVEAFSTTALAAPAFAIAALDPSIRTSFEVGKALMVVWESRLPQALHGKTVASLRDERGVLVLDVSHPETEEHREPVGALRLQQGDRVTFQAPLEAYQRMKADFSLAC